MIRIRPFSSALLLAAVAAAQGAGPDTHLFEARVPDGKTVVFLPAADVESPDDAAAWLRWAGESLPGGREALRAVWDEDPVELELFGMAAPGLLHAGDDAVDPAGRVRFVLAETPEPSAATVRVRLASLPGPGEATPDTACLTNVWILSRDTVFDRCRAAVDAGRPLEARRAIAALLDAGPVHPDTPGYRGWREAIDRFCRANRGVEAAFRVRNGGEDPLRFRIGDGDVVNVPPGRTRDVRPDPDATAVDWTAWSEPVRADDGDYVPERDRATWRRFGDDVELPFDGQVGRLKDDPRWLLPAGAVPAGAAPETFVVYADDPGRPVPSKPALLHGRRVSVSVEPRRAVSAVRLRADGWKTAEFRPAGGKPVALRRGEEETLEGGPMQKDVEPWPGKLVVEMHWNGLEPASGASLRLDGVPMAAAVSLRAGQSRYELPLADALAGEKDETAEKNVAVVAVFGPVADPLRKETSVRRGESVPPVVFECPKPRAAPEVPPAPPAPPWPARAAVDAAKKWLSSADSAAPGLLALATSDDKEIRDPAVTHLRVLQGFWPVSQLEKEHVPTFRAMVSHIAGCFDGNCSFHAPDAADPKREAFRILGWQADAQADFCRETLRYDRRFQWPWKTEMLQSSQMGRWKEDCRKALDRTDPGWKTALDKAFKRWCGVNLNTNEQSSDEPFVKAYRHIEVCPGCHACSPFRDKVAGAPDFEARRKALFRGLVQVEKPLADEVVDAICKEFARLERERNGKGGAR